MSRISALTERYSIEKTKCKEIQFTHELSITKCDNCNKKKKTYALMLRFRGDPECDGDKGKCKECKVWEDEDFAYVCSPECETMLILRVME